MKRFSFSLQKILDVREFERKQAEVELGKAVAEETKIKNTLELIARQRASSVAAADSMRDVSGLFGVNQYLKLLDRQQEQALQSLAQAKIETDLKRAEMKDAMKKCRVLENLKNVRKSEWKKENQKAEETAVDDIVTSRFNRTE